MVHWRGALLIGMMATMAACSGGGGGGDTTIVVITATPGASATPTRSPQPTASLTPSPTEVPPSATPTAPAPTHTLTPVPTATTTPPPTATDTPTLSPTPTETPLLGPVVTAFEVADASGTFNAAIGTDVEGRLIFERQAGAGFILFTEARPGPTRLPPGTLTFSSKPNDPTAQPDLQILTSRPLGDGSLAVCDNSLPGLGGVPATVPFDFSAQQPLTDAMNDLGCRFRVYDEADLACTQDSGGNFLFRSPSSTIQFCTLVSDALTFLPGDTVLSARVRDTSGNAGPALQIVVRIPEG